MPVVVGEGFGFYAGLILISPVKETSSGDLQ
jgi:hypothetical protein